MAIAVSNMNGNQQQDRKSDVLRERTARWAAGFDVISVKGETN
jgi:hypothetical protein